LPIPRKEINSLGAGCLDQAIEFVRNSHMQERIPGVDALRGLAALAVCWFHITITTAILNDGIVRSTGTYGWLGVEVFFVISGFIIPYALQRSGYKVKNYPMFLLKRITRLDPPYLASIVLVIAVAFLFTLTPHYSGEKFAIDPVGLLLHLGYLNVIFHYPWLNPVYWTLAIEFQYYLLVGLMFSLISHKRRIIRVLTFGLLGLTAVLIRRGEYIFAFMFLFLMGMSVFQYFQKIVGRWEFGILILAAAIGVYWSLGMPFTIAGLIGVGGILFLRIRNPILNFLGMISYSLYLIHPPVTRLVLGLGRRFAVNQPLQILLVMAALGMSIFAAYLLYLLVEKPAQRWSSSFKYRTSLGRKQASAEADELSFDAGM
jgi:peptidoglycan/LPS O-acetylase OafA/YrhL